MKRPQDGLAVGTLDGLKRFELEGLDPGIAHFVALLRSQGIETNESCQGGPGHTYPEPTIAFHGDTGEGPRAFAAAVTFGLPAFELRRIWTVVDNMLIGPQWQLTFSRNAIEHGQAVAQHEAKVNREKRTGRRAA